MDARTIQSLVEEHAAAAGIAPSDITGITDCSTEDRVKARVTYSWGRSHEVDLGPVVDAVEKAIDEVLEPEEPETESVSGAEDVDLGELPLTDAPDAPEVTVDEPSEE